MTLGARSVSRSRTPQPKGRRSDDSFRVIQDSDGETDEVFQGRLDPWWLYEKRLTRQDGSWVVAELRVFPYSPEANAPLSGGREELSQGALTGLARGGLTARHLRRVPFGEGPVSNLKALDAICARLARNHRRLDMLHRKRQRYEGRFARGLASTQAGWERDLELARIANSYVEVRRAGSRRPNVEVASILKTTPARVRDAIHQARNRGLMTSDDQKRRGTAKGELTDRAHELLANEDQIVAGKGIRALARAYGLGELADSVPINEGCKTGR